MAAARERVKGAARRLSSAAAQREDLRARARPARAVHELDCDVDVEALQAYLEGRGEERVGTGPRTSRQAVEALMGQAARVTDKVARVRLCYHYSDMGRSLFEAGHITGSREMVKGVDPFRWPKSLREAALGAMGAEFDDRSAYPTAWRAMRGGGGPMTEAFLKNKEEVLGLYGAHLWPSEEESVRRERMKSVMAALDNDGGLSAWRKKWPSNATLAGAKKRLSDGTLFSPSGYKQEQEAATGRAMQESPRALLYMRRLWAGKPQANRKEWKQRMTLKSYMLQEAEAASREAKLRWCREHDVRVISLQHDGVVAMTGESALGRDAMAEAMSEVATAACGYGVKVIPKEAAAVG